MTRHFGLIGYPLHHSFSPEYFKNKFLSEYIMGCDYQAYPLESIDQFIPLIQSKNFTGLNVTIPYKKKIIPYLDVLSDEAQMIGAVNTIKFTTNGLIGHNSDAFGFEQSLLEFIGKQKNSLQALVFGSGGASNAVTYVLKKLEIPFKVVSRDSKKGILYNSVDKNTLDNFKLLINCTPLGMSPKVDESPNIPYQYLNNTHFLYDLVYNPKKTLFLTKGIENQCKTKNGFDMLILQAEKSWQIWNQV